MLHSRWPVPLPHTHTHTQLPEQGPTNPFFFVGVRQVSVSAGSLFGLVPPLVILPYTMYSHTHPGTAVYCRQRLVCESRVGGHWTPERWRVERKFSFIPPKNQGSSEESPNTRKHMHDAISYCMAVSSPETRDHRMESCLPSVCPSRALFHWALREAPGRNSPPRPHASPVSVYR